MNLEKKHHTRIRVCTYNTSTRLLFCACSLPCTPSGFCCACDAHLSAFAHVTHPIPVLRIFIRLALFTHVTYTNPYLNHFSDGRTHLSVTVTFAHPHPVIVTVTHAYQILHMSQTPFPFSCLSRVTQTFFLCTYHACLSRFAHVTHT